MVKHGFKLGVLAGVLLCACTSVSWHYYGMNGVDYSHGMLLGPGPKDDLPFSRCSPGNGRDGFQHKCVVMFVDEFFRFKTEYEDLKTRLSECEKKLP